MNVVGIKSKEILEEYIKNNTKYELGKRFKIDYPGESNRVGYNLIFENGIGLSIVRDTDISIFSKGWREIMIIGEGNDLNIDIGNLGNVVPGTIAKYINLLSKLKSIEEFKGWSNEDINNRYDNINEESE